MDSCIKKFNEKFGSKVINRQYFHRKIRLEIFLSLKPGKVYTKKEQWSSAPGS